MPLFNYENNSIYCMLDYLHLLWIVTAMAPYSRKYDQIRKLYIYEAKPIGLKQTFIILANISLYMVPIVMMLEYGVVIVGEGPTYQDYVLTIFFGFLLCSSLVGLLTIQFKQKDIFNCFAEIHQIDKVLKELGMTASYVLLRRINKSILFATSVSYIVYLSLYLPAKGTLVIVDAANSLCFGLTLVPKITACYYIITFITVVGVKFVNLNQISFGLTKNKIPNGASMDETIKKIGFLHFKLCHVAKLINHTFASPLFAIVWSVFLLINTATIMNIATYKDKGVAMIFWTAFDSSCLFAIIVACELTKYQSNRIGKILCGIDTVCFDKNFTTAEQMNVLLQLFHQKVNFTAGYYINIGFSLVFAFVNFLSMTVIFLQNFQ